MTELRLRVFNSSSDPAMKPGEYYIVAAPGSAKDFIMRPAVLEYLVERTGLWHQVPVVTEP